MAVVSRHGGLAPGMVRTMQEQQLNVILFLYILCQNATHTHRSSQRNRRGGKRLATAAAFWINPLLASAARIINIGGKTVLIARENDSSLKIHRYVGLV